jgi:hypothetical protein
LSSCNFISRIRSKSGGETSFLPESDGADQKKKKKKRKERIRNGPKKAKFNDQMEINSVTFDRSGRAGRCVRMKRSGRRCDHGLVLTTLALLIILQFHSDFQVNFASRRLLPAVSGWRWGDHEETYRFISRIFLPR